MEKGDHGKNPSVVSGALMQVQLLKDALHVLQTLWVTEGTVEKHVRSILAKLRLPETPDDHRRVLAVLTFLDSR